MNKTYVRAVDEGYFCNTYVNEEDGNTALMVNPDAGIDVLIDAAMVRAARIENLAVMFREAEQLPVSSLELSTEELMRMSIAIGAMASEIKRLLQAVLGDDKLCPMPPQGGES